MTARDRLLFALVTQLGGICHEAHEENADNKYLYRLVRGMDNIVHDLLRNIVRDMRRKEHRKRVDLDVVKPE